MKRYEKESFVKNLGLFFGLLEVLLVLLFIELYRTKTDQYHKSLLHKMQLCSYSLECKEFAFDFVPQDKKILNTLHFAQDSYAYFYIPQSNEFYIKILYGQKQLNQDLDSIKKSLGIKFIIASLFLLLISIALTLYTLRPIRKALLLNDEFIKDILHDFNTPITSMVLNLEMLAEEIKNDSIKRLSHSLDTILLLQNNLKSFLHHSHSQSTPIDIGKLLKARTEFIQNIYPHITFSYTSQSKLIRRSNEELLIRILDNLLSNSAKYNKAKGSVNITLKENIVTLEDSGKGIKDTKKIFDRYYKEQGRGLGLGLHIVDKFTKELGIKVAIESQVGVGTKVTLEFKDAP